MNPSIFLSASVPDPNREETRGEVPQRGRISDAVVALVRTCRDLDLDLVFGGHPAISPLVHHAANAYDNIRRIHIYQSREFEQDLPPSARAFEGLVLTEKQADRAASLRFMRSEMLNPQEHNHIAAVFIGGMKGVYDEAALFTRSFPGAAMIPLRSTGGLTRTLPETIQSGQWLQPSPQIENDANSLFRYYRILLDILTPVAADSRRIGAASRPAEARNEISASCGKSPSTPVVVPAPRQVDRNPRRATSFLSIRNAAGASANTVAFGPDDSPTPSETELTVTPNEEVLIATFSANEYVIEDFPAGAVLVEAIDAAGQEERIVAHRLMRIQKLPDSDQFSGKINLLDWKESPHNQLPREFRGPYRASLLAPSNQQRLKAIPLTEIQRYEKLISHKLPLLEELRQLTASLDSSLPH